MTTLLNGQEIGQKVAVAFPEAVVSGDQHSLFIDVKHLHQVAEYLKNTDGLGFNYLTFLTAVDYDSYFELVYRLVSLKHNHSLLLKSRCYGRDELVVPSVVDLWRAAWYQEREIFDLFGIKFDGHPELKRLLLWEGFTGHPLRRDYL